MRGLPKPNTDKVILTSEESVQRKCDVGNDARDTGINWTNKYAEILVESLSKFLWCQIGYLSQISDILPKS